MTGRQHAMPTDALAVGTHTRTEYFTRAHLPDGRIKDSPVQTAGVVSLGDMAVTLAAAFGRSAFPKGTRFERFERTVTTNVSEWAAAESTDEAEAAR